MASKKHVDSELNPFGFHEVEIELSSIKKHTNNPRHITNKDKLELGESLRKFGLLDKPILNYDLTLIAGHQRIGILEDRLITKCICLVPEIKLNRKEVDELLIRHNKNTGDWDFTKLALFDKNDLLNYGFTNEELPDLLDVGGDINLGDTQKTVYPLSPKMSEKYDYVMIVVDNEIDKAYLDTFMELEKMKDYKCDRVGMGRVISFSKFKNIVDEKGIS